MAALRGAVDRPVDGALAVDGADIVHSPHLVREPRRSPREADLRHPACRDESQPRAASGPGRPSSSAAATRSRAWAEKTALEAADAVIAVSNGSRRDILAAYPAIDPDRVHVIYNGIDTEEYAPDPRHARARALRRSTRPSRTSSSSAGSRARRASSILLRAAARVRPRRTAGAVRGRAGHSRARRPRWSGSSPSCATPA